MGRQLVLCPQFDSLHFGPVWHGLGLSPKTPSARKETTCIQDTTNVTPLNPFVRRQPGRFYFLPTVQVEGGLMQLLVAGRAEVEAGLTVRLPY
jgi:hypothetical protein